jgi:cytochrome c biogenesis protein CcmG/thiol:disulfide interchange protein DsbE
LSKTLVKAIPVVSFLIIFVFLFYGLYKDPTEIPSPLIGKKVPSFELRDLEKRKIFQSNDFMGENYLLNVWASWCAACLDEHDLLLEIKNNNLIKIVGLNYKDTNKNAQEWLAKLGNPYEVVLDDNNGNVAIEFGVYGAPETFLISESGIILHKHIGPINNKFISLLKEKISK